MNKEELVREMKILFPNGDPMFYEILVNLGQLHNDKNGDYATIEYPLRNFTTVGEALEKYGLITKGKPALKLALIYAYKQWDAALKLLGRGEEGNVEGIDARLDDIAVYAIIAKILNKRGL